MICDIFKKDINRAIEGVIKADSIDDESVFNEVDEYVVTNELNNKLNDFFDKYSNSIGKPTEAVGVWISGFFGSGKSHLLKILSYILSSKRVHSDIIGELFLEKIEKTDAILKNNIKKSLSLKTDTILFNIDQKADSGAGSRDDNAILQVFLKVFNEHRGYYPKQPSIANFERNLDKRGLYDSFKAKFFEISGSSWDIERDALTFVVEEAAKALSDVTNISVENAYIQLNKLDELYSISIEDFAKEVKEYISTKEPNYRLIFLVDEVGQFIGENTKLMLNLQTIIESLATICKGQAWVVVTSQSAIKDIISTHNGLENDFSKIMGRFDTKLDLTSQNANEVIQKRLLSKDERALPELSSLYAKHQNSLKSIIHFTDRGIQYKNYSNETDFIDTYPFVPYQLDLFQRCIKGLSSNEIFQGRHASIGERSMLNVVQKVAKEIAILEIGTLATFDYFFDGISNIIRPELQTQIILAKNTLDPFSLKILKILFLVKYVKEFNSNIQNITTLMVDNLDVNISLLQNKIKNSLSNLLNQVYIQKVGEVYEFLTNVEKDIENEIKRVEISDIDLTKELSDWIYEDIIKIQKITYLQNKHFYELTKKMDDNKIKGFDSDLMLNIISPLNYEDYDHSRLIHKSLADRDVILFLGSDFEFKQELKMHLQTQKFIPMRQSGNLTDQEKYILQTKGTDNQKRKKELIEKLKQRLENCSIFYNGKEINKNSLDIKKNIESIFNEVIPIIYTNISMLQSDLSENNISTIINDSNDLFQSDATSLDAASNEILSFLNRSKKDSQAITISDIINKYSAKPYGWYQAGIQCTIAKLFAKALITITLNGTSQNKTGAISTLTNSRSFNALIKVVESIPVENIKKAKKILSELFCEISFETLSVANLIETASKLANERKIKLINLSHLNYPFAKNLSRHIELYNALTTSTQDNFIDEIIKKEDDLLDGYEDDLAKLFEFMSNGGQRQIYDDCKRFLEKNIPNSRHLNKQKLKELDDILVSANVYKQNTMPLANRLKDELIKEFEPLLNKAQKNAQNKLDDIIASLQQDSNFMSIADGEKYKVIRPIQDLKNQITATDVLDSINAIALDETLLAKGLQAIEELIPNKKDVQIVTRINFKDIYQKSARLKTKEDVENYIEHLKKEMLKAIDEQKEILA